MSDHVQELLTKQGIRYQISGRDFLISCLNPDHNDSNPSCRVDRITGVTHCFSCGFKTNIFKHFGIVQNFVSIKVAKLKNKLKELNVNLNGVEFPDEVIPYTKSFRGISNKTLHHFGAFYTHGSSEYADRIWFPIRDVRGKAAVYVGRHTMSNGNPRYLNFPTGVTMPVYPEVLHHKTGSVVLVEGIFDMLNLYDKGLTNVCCTFGTNTLFKEAEMKLLALKTQGVAKIYLMFDGDDPGQKAMLQLEPVLQECGYIVEKIVLEPDSDPGELTQEYVDSIKEYINEKDSYSRQSTQQE
jgi:DNA primase